MSNVAHIWLVRKRVNELSFRSIGRHSRKMFLLVVIAEPRFSMCHVHFAGTRKVLEMGGCVAGRYEIFLPIYPPVKNHVNRSIIAFNASPSNLT